MQAFQAPLKSLLQGMGVLRLMDHRTLCQLCIACNDSDVVCSVGIVINHHCHCLSLLPHPHLGVWEQSGMDGE